jgi:hypothetical protein
MKGTDDQWRKQTAANMRATAAVLAARITDLRRWADELDPPTDPTEDTG